MANFPTYLMDENSINKFVEVLRANGSHVAIYIDRHLTAQGSYYTGYETFLENGGKLVFWSNIYSADNHTTLTIGNPSGRLGRVALELAMQYLDVLGQRL
jgi:hypothetical protein